MTKFSLGLAEVCYSLGVQSISLNAVLNTRRNLNFAKAMEKYSFITLLKYILFKVSLLLSLKVKKNILK